MTLRNRSRGLLTPINSATLWRYTGNGNPWVQNAISLPYMFGDVENMTDSVTPNFRKRQAAGEKFFNNMYYSRIGYQSGGGTGYQIHDANNGERIDGQTLHIYIPHTGTNALVSTVLLIGSSEISRLASEVSTRVLNDRGRSDSNLWETLAEADKTIEMLRSPYSKLLSAVNSAAKAKMLGRFPGYALNGVSNLYLAYRYGIRPIINDVQGIISGLKQKTGKQQKTTRAKRQINRFEVRAGSGTVGIIKVDYSNIINDTVTIRATCLDEVVLSSLNNIGFSAKGLLTLPWELVSYSFVADWIANVGDFIGALTPAFGWNSLGSCLSISREVSNLYVPTGTTCMSGAYTLDRSVSGSFTTTSTSKGRGPLAPAALVIKSDFKFDNFTRAADAWALLGQRFSSVFR